MRRLFVILSWMAITGCGASGGGDDFLPAGEQAVFIVCEGNYGASNATLSILETTAYDTTFTDVYKKANGNKLGDMAHSMLMIDSLGFIAVTFSDKIEIINTRTFESEGTIENIKTPRNLVYANGKLYATSYEDSAVIRIDYSTHVVESSIKLRHRPDEIAVLGNKVFVSNSPNRNDSVISVIDLASERADTIIVGKNPVALVADNARNRIYVACSGLNGGAGFIAVIDANSESMIAKLEEFQSVRPVKLALQDSLLAYISGSNSLRIYNLNLNAAIKSISNNLTFYSLSFIDGELMATDGLDFVSSGFLYRFDAQFNFKKQYPVGVAPSAIVGANQE
ncbi:hypothetical protein HUU42_12190 [bacterium]|nr:hypothetical protein [bacterium]